MPNVLGVALQLHNTELIYFGGYAFPCSCVKCDIAASTRLD